MKKKYVIISAIAAILLIGGTIWLNRAAEPLPEASSILMINGFSLEEIKGITESVVYVFEIPDEETELIEKFSELVSSLELSYCPAYYVSFLAPDRTAAPSWNIGYLRDNGDMVVLFFDNGLNYMYVANFETTNGLCKVTNMEEWREEFYDFLWEAEAFAEKRW